MIAWTNHEIALLTQLYPAAPWPVIETAIPRHSRQAIRARATWLSLHRNKSTEFAHQVDPFVAQLARLRIEEGWTQTDVAGWLNVDRSVLSGYESGRRAFHNLDVLYRWVALFGLQLKLTPLDAPVNCLVDDDSPLPAS